MREKKTDVLEVSGEQDPTDNGGGINRSHFLTTAGGAMVGIATGLAIGAAPASAATKYPAEVDKSLKPEEEAGAILAIEAELGANPSGSDPTVKAALDARLPLTVFPLSAYGAVGDGSADDAPALRAAIEAATTIASAGGTAIVQGDGRKTYKLSSAWKQGSVGKGGAVQIPHKLSGRLEFHGDGCKFLLTSNVRRLFDCVETEGQHDVIQNFLAQEFTIDAGKFHKPEHREHIVFGNQIDGNIQKNLGFENITIRRWTVVNAYTHGADGAVETSLTGVYMRLKQAGTLTTEPQRDVARNIVLNEWRMFGGLVGIDVGGESGVVVTDNEKRTHSAVPNVSIDEIYVEDWYHSSEEAFSEPLRGSSIQLGHYCLGGTVTVRNGFSEFSGDVGVEIDFFEKALVENVTVKDARNSCFLSPGMGRPLLGGGAKSVSEEEIESPMRATGVQYFVNCRAIRQRSSGNCIGFHQQEGSGNSGFGAPRVYYENCSVHASRPSITSADQAWFMDGGAELASLTNCRVDVVGIKESPEAEADIPLVVLGTASSSTLSVRGLDVVFRGKVSSGQMRPVFLQLNGAVGVQQLLDVRGVTVRDELIGGAVNPRYVKVAVGPSNVGFRGALEVAILADGDSAESVGVAFYPGAKINGRLNVTVDAQGMDSAEPKAFVFLKEFEDGAKVRFVNSNFKKVPPRAEIAPLPSPYSYVNADGYPEQVAVRGGSVSKIELDGMVTGVTAGTFRVEPGDVLTVTYSAKPTMEKLPSP